MKIPTKASYNTVTKQMTIDEECEIDDIEFIEHCNRKSHKLHKIMFGEPLSYPDEFKRILFGEGVEV